MRAKHAFTIRERGTYVPVEFDDDGLVRVGDMALLPLRSGEVRQVIVRAVEIASGDLSSRPWSNVVLGIGEVAPDEIALDVAFEVRRPET